jgi:hypothetical protein
MSFSVGVFLRSGHPVFNGLTHSTLIQSLHCQIGSAENLGKGGWGDKLYDGSNTFHSIFCFECPSYGIRRPLPVQAGKFIY